VDSETIGTRKGQKGNDVEIMQERERAWTKTKFQKRKEKDGAQHTVFGGQKSVLRDVLSASPWRGGCDVDADADLYTDSFALVYPLQLVSFSPRPGFEARATKRQVWPPLGGCFHARQGTSRDDLVQGIQRG
jgi:hypothetical protein